MFLYDSCKEAHGEGKRKHQGIFIALSVQLAVKSLNIFVESLLSLRVGRVILAEGRLRQALCSNIGVYRRFVLKILNYPRNVDFCGTITYVQCQCWRYFRLCVRTLYWCYLDAHIQVLLKIILSVGRLFRVASVCVIAVIVGHLLCPGMLI